LKTHEGKCQCQSYCRSKSIVDCRLEKSHKRKKKQHKSKKNHDDTSVNRSTRSTSNEKHLPPPLPSSSPPPPPPPPTSQSSLYDDLDETTTMTSPIVKTNLSLSHSPPPVMPTILRQGSRSRLNPVEQLVPSSVIRSGKQTNKLDAGKYSPILTNPSNDELATKKFEEQLALLDANAPKSAIVNWDQTSGSEDDDRVERIFQMNGITALTGPIQFKLNRTQTLPLKTSPVSNETMLNDNETMSLTNTMKKKRLHKPTELLASSRVSRTPSSSSSLSDVEKTTKMKKNKKKKITTSTSCLHFIVLLFH
jgi:hypothetical protein